MRKIFFIAATIIPVTICFLTNLSPIYLLSGLPGAIGLILEYLYPIYNVKNIKSTKSNTSTKLGFGGVGEKPHYINTKEQFIQAIRENPSMLDSPILKMYLELSGLKKEDILGIQANPNVENWEIGDRLEITDFSDNLIDNTDGEIFTSMEDKITGILIDKHCEKYSKNKTKLDILVAINDTKVYLPSKCAELKEN